MRSIAARVAALGAAGLVAVAGATAAAAAPTAPSPVAPPQPPPAGAVAAVGGVPITDATFNHWMVVAANSLQSSSGGSTTRQPVPVPPRYTACIRALGRRLRKLSRRGRTVGVALLRSVCAAEYKSDLEQVMQFLVSAAWVQGEAALDGIHISNREVAVRFATIKKEQFPTPAAYRSFLASSGETRADLLLRVKLEMLSTALRELATSNVPAITAAQIAAYYAAHRASFDLPERLDARVILTATRAQALVALHAIHRGTPFAREARKASIDFATRDQGGAVTGIRRSQSVGALHAAALFAAPLHTVEGPVRTPAGYYLFTVTRVLPPLQQSLQQASPAITDQLTAAAQSTALDNWITAFTQRWTAQTSCRAGYVVMDCQGYTAGLRPGT